MALQGLINLWDHGREGPYAIRHSQMPASDFPMRTQDGELMDTNFWEKTYPVLFPYGAGGPERRRRVHLSLTEHVQWLLQQHDFRFRRHDTFAFLVCSILQRRQCLLSAKLQMKHSDFDREAMLFTSLKLEDLKQAEKEESEGRPISNYLVRLLRQRAFGTTRSVMGSDASHLAMRAEIQATNMVFNAPNLWLTINPDDLHDPIPQLFCNEEIDMDSFDRKAGPNRQQRARNVTGDAFAAAKFFNFIIGLVLEILMDVKVTPRRVESGRGVFGRVRAFFGTVECQGRGTLHLHLLIWLDDSPTTERMRTLLSQQHFREKVRAYIRANIHAHHPAISNAASINSMPTNPEVAYSRPPNPNSPTFWEDFNELELQLMRTKQMHTCGAGCHKVDRYGNVSCKRHAPWPLSEDVQVAETGMWEPKRTYGYQNGSSPAISVCVRCNNDLKVMLNGPETEGVSFYVASYSTKKLGRTHNMSALINHALSFHRMNDPYIENLMESHRLLLFRCANIINKQQELPLTMCMSYLMGWGDTFKSHKYVPLYWTSYHRALIQQFPDMTKSSSSER